RLVGEPLATGLGRFSHRGVLRNIDGEQLDPVAPGGTIARQRAQRRLAALRASGAQTQKRIFALRQNALRNGKANAFVGSSHQYSSHVPLRAPPCPLKRL